MKTAVLTGVAAFAITAASIAVAQQAPAPKEGRTVTRAEVSTKIREGFARLDSNRDGFLTQAEADAARMARRGAMGGQMRGQVFDRLDTNRDGQISRQEFDARRPEGPRDGSAQGRPEGMGGMHGMHGKRMGGLGVLRGRMFQTADANRDGRVSLQEATDAALRHFDMADANRDGSVTPQERQQMRGQMRNQAAPRS